MSKEKIVTFDVNPSGIDYIINDGKNLTVGHILIGTICYNIMKDQIEQAIYTVLRNKKNIIKKNKRK